MRLLHVPIAVSSCLVALCILLGCRGTSGELGGDQPDWLPADTVMLDNGVVRLGVSPQLGKVVDFGLVGGENLIWVNQAEAQAYLNDLDRVAEEKRVYYKVGGDKLWPTVQPHWPSVAGRDWPPDRTIDGSAWTLATRDRSSLTIESGLSRDYGIVVSRRFELCEGKAQVQITNTFRRVSTTSAPLTIWSVTQIRRPQFTVLDIAHDRPSGETVVHQLGNDTLKRNVSRWKNIDDEIVVWRHTNQANVKLATMGRWVAAVYGDLTFVQEGDFDPVGDYPDASSVQVFYPLRGFTELEFLSPQQVPHINEEIQDTLRWSLIRVSADDAIDALLALDQESCQAKSYASQTFE